MPQQPFYTGKRFQILYYVLPNGACPVDTYLNGLTERRRKRLVALFQETGDEGPPRNREKGHKVEGQSFFELKAHQERVFWRYAGPGRIILLHGFTKKQNRIRRSDLKAGRDRYAEVEDELERGKRK